MHACTHMWCLHSKLEKDAHLVGNVARADADAVTTAASTSGKNRLLDSTLHRSAQSSRSVIILCTLLGCNVRHAATRAGQQMRASEPPGAQRYKYELLGQSVSP